MWRPFYARGLLYSHSLTLVNAERLTYRPSETPSFLLPTRNQSGILNRYHPVREPADHTHPVFDRLCVITDVPLNLIQQQDCPGHLLVIVIAGQAAGQKRARGNKTRF
ncbi:hypothetical protein CEP52_003069 [Fusarium oligoseptatum]|uniref:Uncharacterized protein n=1 Tax=Fusarium oligoseptatum TaxID=2604345 RepID=A0A428UB03_9HYPO|nr:hypothetical protein CEP52_003069 [Fusarium oligoseptatum]